MDSKFSDLIAYFELLATQHKSIGHSDNEKHFFRLELEEVFEQEKPGIGYPALVLEGYGISYSDQGSDNVQKSRSGAFILLDRVEDPNDFDLKHEKWDELERIGDDLLVRMLSDKRSHQVAVVRDFSINETDGALLQTDLNEVGVRYTYRLSSPLINDVDTERWQ